MSTKPVRVAVVGYGWWGKTIVRTLAGSAAVKVAMVVEPDNTVRDAARGDASAGGFALTAEFAAALASPEVDAVVLCSRHKALAAQISAAAAAGKHVFCEKPLCLSYADAVASVEACRKAGVQLGIGHERRFEPAVQALRQRISSGELGSILQIEANFSQDKFFALPPDNWRLSKEHAPVGPLSATGIHLVDLSIAILGPAENVWARLATRGSQFANGDTLAIMLGFAGGATSMISAMLATPFEGRLAVYGSRGWVEIRDRTHPENPTGWDVTTAVPGGERSTEFVSPHASVRANLEAFAGAVAGGAAYPVSHREMLANVAALESIMRSTESGRIEAVPQPGL
jgi:predicted dehydrogenase